MTTKPPPTKKPNAALRAVGFGALLGAVGSSAIVVVMFVLRRALLTYGLFSWLSVIIGLVAGFLSREALVAFGWYGLRKKVLALPATAPRLRLSAMTEHLEAVFPCTDELCGDGWHRCVRGTIDDSMVVMRKVVDTDFVEIAGAPADVPIARYVPNYSACCHAPVQAMTDGGASICVACKQRLDTSFPRSSSHIVAKGSPPMHDNITAVYRVTSVEPNEKKGAPKGGISVAMVDAENEADGTMSLDFPASAFPDLKVGDKIRLYFERELG